MRDTYAGLDDLPPHLREHVVRVGEHDPAEWVLQPIPLLGGRSIMEAMNEPDGAEQVRSFLARVVGTFT
jgi:Protein of unknown function (DUF2384)